MNRKPTDGTEEIAEEADYMNAPVCTVDEEAAPADQRRLFFTRSLPLTAVCWLVLLLIVGLRIYSVTNVISENEAKLTAEIRQLKTLMQHLNLSKDVSTLLAAVQNRSAELRTRWGGGQLNRTTARDTETNLNVSRAQWSVDAYCPKSTGRRCQPCQNDWNYFQSSCYVMLHPDPPDWKNWEEAREDCRGRNSDLVFIDNAAEKSIISHYSWGSSGTDGHWIGLRVEDGGWKWVDGSDLNETSWIDAPADGHCGVSVTDVGWRSVSCSNRNRWSCKKTALSV